MPSKQPAGDFRLEIPLDASSVENFKPDQPVKVLVQDAKGTRHSQLVVLNAKGHGTAQFAFKQHPGGLRVILGPHNATDEQLTGLQTIGIDVAARQWIEGTRLKLSPIRISPYYWWWWFIWCREFIIRGTV